MFNTKVDQNKKACKFNDPDVYNLVKDLYENGTKLDVITENVLISRTKLKTMIKEFKKPAAKNRICVFTAHCLIFEHGLNYVETARILGVHPSSLTRARKRQIPDFKKKYKKWKEDHTKWRKSLRVQTIRE